MTHETKEQMPAMLQVAACIVAEHPADDQMAFLVCMIARLAMKNEDNPQLEGIKIYDSNLETAVSFLTILKKKVDSIPAINDEESSECQH